MDKLKDRFLLSPKEAGAHLGLSENKIRALCKSGEIPAAHSGVNFKIAKPLLEQWAIEKCKEGAEL